MALTAALVYQGRNRLRYLLTQDGAAGTTLNITTTGAATPDLRTDAAGGAIEQIARAFDTPYYGVGGGAMTQAQARKLLLSDETGGLALYTGEPFARCIITPRTAAVQTTFLVDANVDGGGNPLLALTSQAGAATAYLDVEVSNQIGA